MGQCAINAPTCRCVRIGFDQLTQHGFACIVSPNQAIAQEETLVRGKTIFCVKRVLLHGILQCLIGYIQTAVVGSVLAQGEFAIGIEVGQNFYIVKEVAFMSVVSEEGIEKWK